MDPLVTLIDAKITKILRIFSKNKNKTFYLREISKQSGVPLASTHRLLKKIVKTGLIEEIKISKFTFYKLSKKAKLEGVL